MFRTTLLTPRARRCSGVVVAATTAALVLAPGAAFAAGQPAGPGQPETGHSAGTGHSSEAGTGHTTGHAGGHAGSHKGGRSGRTTGHSTGHATGRTGHSTGHSGTGHSGSHTTGHAAGRAGSGHSASHTTGHPRAGHTTGHRAAHSTASRGADGGMDTAPDRSGSASGASTPGAPGGSMSGNPQGPGQKDMADTVTKLSVSNSAGDGSLTMSARVSMAHRTPGASPATGTVDFTVDGTSSGPIPLSGGRATVQVELGPGEHTGSARYSGDAEHAPSDSGPVSITAE